METVYATGVEGRVCFVTQEQTRSFATVEDPEGRIAYRFQDPMPSPLKVGDWVRFSGHARVKVVSRKGEPERLESREYYHVPYDGTPKRDWKYVELAAVHMCEVLGHPSVIRVLREASASADLLVRDWGGRSSAEALRGTAGLLREAAIVLESLAKAVEAEAESARARPFFSDSLGDEISRAADGPAIR